jgi:hypothetical protein
MKARCEKEIVDLHQFFQDWFTGTLPATEENFERVVGVLNDDFVLIGPDGKLTELRPLLEWLRHGHGARPVMRLWVKNVHLRWQQGEIGLATYEEWQETDRGPTARLSTALFQEKPGTPNGLVWRHVHETWLT